jgi:hypothetical protein
LREEGGLKMDRKFATGGLVINAAGDSIPVLLSRGSFDLPAEVVRKHGADLIARRNGSATAEEGKVKNVMSLFGIGSPVTYVDSTGHARPALVTNCFGPLESKPSINVVVVNDDDNQTDTYGRKIERFTSVVHQDNQYAHGNYWKPISE